MNLHDDTAKILIEFPSDFDAIGARFIGRRTKLSIDGKPLLFKNLKLEFDANNQVLVLTLPHYSFKVSQQKENEQTAK